MNLKTITRPSTYMRVLSPLIEPRYQSWLGPKINLISIYTSLTSILIIDASLRLFCSKWLSRKIDYLLQTRPTQIFSDKNTITTPKPNGPEVEIFIKNISPPAPELEIMIFEGTPLKKSPRITPSPSTKSPSSHAQVPSISINPTINPWSSSRPAFPRASGIGPSSASPSSSSFSSVPVFTRQAGSSIVIHDSITLLLVLCFIMFHL